jgi:hypothetical protein
MIAPQPPPAALPPDIVEIVETFTIALVVLILGIPIVRVMMRRWERSVTPPAPMPVELTNRLERIEQAVDTVAIEVERISEAQRFQAKLMAEQRPALPQQNRD